MTVTFVAQLADQATGRTMGRLLASALTKQCPVYEPEVKLVRHILRKRGSQLAITFSFADSYSQAEAYKKAHHWLTRACHSTKISLYDMSVEFG